MKKFILLCLVGVFVMAPMVAFAQEKAPLGAGNLAVKVDYIQFTEDDLEDADVDSGLYLGVEGFAELVSNVYLGAEVGYAFIQSGDFFEIDDRLDVDLTYVPVEVNLKYAAELSPQFIIDVGAGLSYNYAKIDVQDYGDEDEWLFGGQCFVDLNYTFDTFFLGINGKYQLTEEGDDLETNFDNWRIGGQIGFFF